MNTDEDEKDLQKMVFICVYLCSSVVISFRVF